MDEEITSSSTNVSDGCESMSPTLSEIYGVYFSARWSACLLVMAFVSSFFTLVVFCYAAKKVREHNPFGTERRRLILRLFGLFPVFSVTSVCGIVAPRASFIVEWASSVYLAVALYSFLRLLIVYYGGYAAMITTLSKTQVSFAQAPLFCWCKCCWPPGYITEKRFHILRYLILQVMFIRPLCVFISAILWADGIQQRSVIKRPDIASFWFSNIAGISTMFAVYSLLVFNNASREHLKSFFIRSKFAVIQLVLVTTTLVNIVVAVMEVTNSIPCVGPFKYPERAQAIYNHVIIHLMSLNLLVFLTYWIWISRYSDQRDAVNANPMVTAYDNNPDMIQSEMKITQNGNQNIQDMPL